MSVLDTARIISLPGNAYYIPNFITVEEEERILHKVIIRPDTGVYLVH